MAYHLDRASRYIAEQPLKPERFTESVAAGNYRHRRRFYLGGLLEARRANQRHVITLYQVNLRNLRAARTALAA